MKARIGEEVRVHSGDLQGSRGILLPKTALSPRCAKACGRDRVPLLLEYRSGEDAHIAYVYPDTLSSGSSLVI